MLQSEIMTVFFTTSPAIFSECTVSLALLFLNLNIHNMRFHEKKILESTYKDVVPIESCHKLNGLTHIYPVLLKWNGAIYLRHYESLEKRAIFCLSTSRVMNLLHIVSSKNWRTKSVTSIGQINLFFEIETSTMSCNKSAQKDGSKASDLEGSSSL